YRPRAPPVPHSFPTRRSSDLKLRAQNVGETAQKQRVVDTRICEPADESEHLSGTALENHVEEREKLVLGNEPEGLTNALGGDATVAHRQHLIGETERVTHRAVSGTRDHGKRLRLRRKTLVREYCREAALDLSGPDALEVKSLKAAENRRRRLRDLLRLSCREDKDNARRRL